MYKKIGVHLLVLILLSSAPGLAAPVNVGKCAAHTDAAVFIQGKGGTSIQPVSSKLAVEVIHGKRAEDYLEKVKKEKPERFKKAGHRLKELGYKPTKEVVVYRTVNIAASGSGGSRNGNNPLVLPAQDSYSDSEGEVIFWSWDDGDDDTWEGVTSVESYSDGGYATYESQALIVTEDYDTVWEDQTSYGGGGGGGGGDDEWMTSLPGLPTPSLQLAALEPAPWVGGETPRGITRAASLGNWRAFLICFSSYCGGTCTRTCRGTGPFWSKCMGACCGYWLIRCALWYLR